MNVSRWMASMSAPESRRPDEERLSAERPIHGPTELSSKASSGVLVVDDDPDTLDAVAEALELEGLAVSRALSGREALALAEAHPPDLAIIDLIMPEVSGEDVCAAFRRDPRLAKTRLLVLSAAEDTRVVAASCDADGAIVKPFTTALLLHEVRRLLS